jgi:hypothetical protein
MWTLVIITIAFTGALSGASSSTSYLDFPDQLKCEAAAIAIGAPDWIRITPGGPQRSPSIGGYRIITRCVQHKDSATSVQSLGKGEFSELIVERSTYLPTARP